MIFHYKPPRDFSGLFFFGFRNVSSQNFFCVRETNSEFYLENSSEEAIFFVSTFSDPVWKKERKERQMEKYVSK